MTTRFALLLLLLPIAAPAETVEEALRGIPRVAGVCRADDVTQAADSRPARQAAADYGCGIDPLAARDLLADEHAMLVDVRPATAFAVSHIEGAANLSLAELKTKTYLAAQAVVIVGDGKAEAALYRSCAGLKAAGFARVNVLRGGLPAWLASALPALGTPRPLAELATLTADELSTEILLGSPTVLLLPPAAGMTRQLPAATLVKSTSVPAIVSAAGRPADARGLIVAGKLDALRIDEIIAALRPRPALFYLGDEAQYVHARVTQENVWAAQERGPPMASCNSQ